ncbi:hypothetical protein [Bounagaea algeriensis]
MTRAETQRVLAVLMRQGEWMLDDAAHSVGGGRLSQQRCHDTAVALEDLAAFLRECCAELPEQSGAEAHRAAPGMRTFRLKRSPVSTSALVMRTMIVGEPPASATGEE